MPGGAVAAKLEKLSEEEAREILYRAGFSEADLCSECVVGRGGMRTVLLVGLFSAIGGGLFGLDIGYISGVLTMRSLSDDLLSGGHLADQSAGAITGIFALGAVVAAFPAVIGAVVDRLGRTRAIVLGGAIFCLGALLQAVSPNLTAMYVGRFIAGAAVGLLSANIPIFQGEIAPPSARGAIVALYQLAITVGIMVAFWVNFALQDVAHGWRWSIAAQLLPGALLVTGGLVMPGSPRWLVQKGRPCEALATLLRIRGPHDDVLSELAVLCREHEREAAAGQATCSEFCSGTNRRVLAIGILLQLVQQTCGLNAFMYYGPEIFQKVFDNPQAPFLFSAITGVVNFLSTFPAIFLADRAGRMRLLAVSAAGMSVCCALLAIVGSKCFAGEDALEHPVCGPWSQWVVAGSIFVFIFNFAFGWGPVVWIYCAEIFPAKHSTRSNGLTTDANWVGNFLIGFLPPVLLANLGFATFWIFAAINLLGAVLACVLPETKGRSLEEIQLLFDRWPSWRSASQAKEEEAVDAAEAQAAADKAAAAGGKAGSSRSLPRLCSAAADAAPLPQEHAEAPAAQVTQV